MSAGGQVCRRPLLTNGPPSLIKHISYITYVLFMRTDQLSMTFAALSDPTRRAILATLASGEAGVMELAKPFDISQPAISRHLKVLEQAGLIVRGRNAQSRPCRLEATPIKEIVEWAQRYRQFWDQSFDRLGEYLGELQKPEKKRGRKSR
jgi:DNA-binding transcriptional ArsR family regulator